VCRATHCGLQLFQVIGVERWHRALRIVEAIVIATPPFRRLRGLVNREVRYQRFCFLIEDDVFAWESASNSQTRTLALLSSSAASTTPDCRQSAL